MIKSKSIILIICISIFKLTCISFVAVSAQGSTEPNFFNGKNLNGWSASDMSFWSVENGAIVGHSDQEIKENEFLWSEVSVKDFYLSVDVKLEPNNRNAGIQFRSEKINGHGQAIGYQADVGMGWWGKLYHEHGRGPLDFTDKGEKAVKPGQWNHYEILAVDDRIWTAINGVISVSVKDPGGEKSGNIAFQIHSGPPQTVQYRINKLVHDPEIKLAGYSQQELNNLLKSPLVPPPAELSFNNGRNYLLFAGNGNTKNMQRNGYVSELFRSSFPDKKFSFQNIGWAGNTIFEQLKDSSIVEFDKKEEGTNIIFLQFGQMEALGGEDGLPKFIDAYKKILKRVKGIDQQVVLISPIPFGSSILNKFNNNIEKYSLAIKKLAEDEECFFVDLYQHFRVYGNYINNLTTDGIHLNENGHRLLTIFFARGIVGLDESLVN